MTTPHQTRGKLRSPQGRKALYCVLINLATGMKDRSPLFSHVRGFEKLLVAQEPSKVSVYLYEVPCLVLPCVVCLL